MRYSILAILLLSVSNLIAEQIVQTPDVAKQILRIKRDEAYFSTESTAETWQEAYDYSVSQLLLLANIERSNLGLTKLQADELLSVINHLTISRGPLQRVFVYVTLKDLGIEQDLPQHTNRPDTVAVLTPLNPIRLEEIPDVVPNIIMDVAAIEKSEIQESILASFKMVETSREAQLLLDTFKKEGKISEFGKLQSQNDLQTGRYLLASYQRRIIRALLQVREDGIFNINTQQLDNLENYSDCAIVWFY